MSESASETETISTTFHMNNGKVLTPISKESKERIFKGILSGEVIDKEGDFIPIKEFQKFFSTLIKRQTPILLKHQPIHVGQIISLEKTSYNGIPAVLVEARIFDDFPMDHETWAGIIKGKYFGMSFTGEVEQTIVKCDGNKCHKERKLSAIYELTITDMPANQVSTIMLDYLSKEHKQTNEVNKMTEPAKEEKAPVPTLSKEDLQAELKTLGEGIASTIKEGFETFAKTLQKEDNSEKDEDEKVTTPANPQGDEEEEEEKDEPVSKEEPELKWDDISEKFGDEIKAQVQKELDAQRSTISTPTGIPAGGKVEAINYARLPTADQLAKQYTK